MSISRTSGVLGLLFLVWVPGALAQATPAAQQIAAAVRAGPPDRRADATVLGYDAAGKLVMLRKGSNDLICLADDPARPGFEVDCYHESLEPYMARGRELRAQGVTGAAINQTRWKEAAEGKLAMPVQPAILYVLAGRNASFDTATGQVKDARARWVIYVPGATVESTGLSTTPIPGGPWIMFPGTPGAHIMIVPTTPGQSGSRN